MLYVYFLSLMLCVVCVFLEVMLCVVCMFLEVDIVYSMYVCVLCRMLYAMSNCSSQDWYCLLHVNICMCMCVVSKRYFLT